jgi:hypothetical protein
VSFSNTKSRLKALPEGYVAIPITEDQKSTVLKICVLVKNEPDDVAGHLVVIRNTMDAGVFLGCIVDSCGQVQEWLELWIQNSGSLVDPQPARCFRTPCWITVGAGNVRPWKNWKGLQ